MSFIKLDIFVYLVIIIGLIVGFWRGFLKHILFGLAIIGGVLVPFFLGGALTKAIEPHTGMNPETLRYVVYGGLGIGTFIILAIVALIFKKNIKGSSLGLLDSLIGSVLGAAQAILFIAFVFQVIHLIESTGAAPSFIEKINNDLANAKNFSLAKYLYEHNIIEMIWNWGKQLFTKQ